MSNMSPFSSDDLARMQAAQQAAMQDTCVIQTYAAGQPDPYGLPTPTWTPGAPSACGLGDGVHREVMNGAQVIITDAILRLPLASVISQQDRVSITHRFGVALSVPQLFQVIGQPMRGPSGLRVNLQSVSDPLAA